jgi:hypothetical protein
MNGDRMTALDARIAVEPISTDRFKRGGEVDHGCRYVTIGGTVVTVRLIGADLMRLEQILDDLIEEWGPGAPAFIEKVYRLFGSKFAKS